MSRIIHLFLPVLSLGVSAGVSADCVRNEYGIFEAKPCAIDALELDKRELKVAYESLLAKLDKTQRVALVKSQDAWSAYVDAEVNLNYAIEGDGADGRTEAVQIRELRTHERVQELSKWRL